MKPNSVLLCVLFFFWGNITFSQTNLDFETGNFSGWTGAIGANLNSNVIFTPCSTATPAASNGTDLNLFVKSYFAIMTTAATADYYGGFSLTSPLGGTKIARLGNEGTNVNEGGDCTTSKNPTAPGATPPSPNCYCSTICGTPVGSGYIQCPAEYIRQSFTVTAANSYLKYAYAVVLNDGTHPVGSQPYFEVKVTDGSGTSIPCFYNKVQLNTNTSPAGWSLSANRNRWYAAGSPGAKVFYKGWTTAQMNLSAYIGQTVTIQYAVAGCTDGAHFGYAYFDATTGSAPITAGAASLCAPSTTTVTAPPSTAYSWTASGGGVISGATNGQSITATSAGTYTVTINSGACATPLAITVGPCGLPIELSQFIGNVNEEDNLLYWETESERNNDYFILERSKNGVDFEILTHVKGAGNATVLNTYSFIDENVTNELYYYRLSQTDFDGTKVYFNTITIKNIKVKKEIVGYYNLIGESVNADYKGFVIVVYSDGTSEKIIVN